MVTRFFILALFAILLPSLLFARPVSYPGGWTVMQLNEAKNNSLQLHYSPSSNYSLGYRGIYFSADDNDWTYQGFQLNYLVKRWNNPDSQANFYFNNSIGTAIDFDSSSDALAGFSEIATDWETRRFFWSYRAKYIEAGQIDSFFEQSTRIGIAPYLGNYGDIHTWLMLQLNHDPEGEDNTSVTPLVRLFKAEYLFEAGVNLEGAILFNWIIRF